MKSKTPKSCLLSLPLKCFTPRIILMEASLDQDFILCVNLANLTRSQPSLLSRVQTWRFYRAFFSGCCFSQQLCSWVYSLEAILCWVPLHCNVFSHKYNGFSFWTKSTYLVCRGVWCQPQAKESQRDGACGWFVKWCQLGAVCTMELICVEKNTKGCTRWCFSIKRSALKGTMKPAQLARNRSKGHLWWSWKKCKLYMFVSMSAKEFHILILPSWSWNVKHHLILCLGSPVGYVPSHSHPPNLGQHW